MKNKSRKPWGKNRIPVAPAGSRHTTAKEYRRHLLPDVAEEWWDELNNPDNAPEEEKHNDEAW